VSVPIVAATLADAIAPILAEIEASIGHKVMIDRTTVRHSDRSEVVFSAYIHAHDRAFSGLGDRPSRALMIANTELQNFEDSLPQSDLPA